MKIGFDAKRLFLNQTGLGNYSRDVVKDIWSLFPNHDYHLFTPEVKQSSRTDWAFNQPHIQLHKPKGLCGNLSKSYWRSFCLEQDLVKQNIDVFHGLSNEIPKRKERDKLKYVVTIHDLIFLHYPEYYKTIDRKIYNKKFRYAAENSDVVVAISKQSKQDIVEHYNIHPDKIEVVYQSCHETFKSLNSNQEINNFKQELNIPNDYLLNVGTIEHRKNLEVIIRALPQLYLPLVVVGKKTDYFFKVIQPLISKLKVESKIMFLEGLSVEQLSKLYQGANAFIYPSLYEGFGIPVLEALYSKTPVITSNDSSLKEIGNNSILINPQETDELIDAIENKLSAYDIDMAYNFAQSFSSEHQAKQLMNIYGKL